MSGNDWVADVVDAANALEFSIRAVDETTIELVAPSSTPTIVVVLTLEANYSIDGRRYDWPSTLRSILRPQKDAVHAR